MFLLFLFFKKNKHLIHVTAIVLLVVSNLLYSFPGKRKSSLTGIFGFLYLSAELFQDFTVAWSESIKPVCSLCNSLNQ